MKGALAWRSEGRKLLERSRSWVATLFPRRLAAESVSEEAAAPPLPAIAVVEGTQTGWLRILSAADLLHYLRAEEVLERIRTQSKLSDETWQRDFLTALRNYAEFVQLMPASESHHHAHRGGLLVHTLEVVLLALTWRHGFFLPSGAKTEQVSAEEDAWTYVVFFAALLHDIGKPLTDLLITWRASGTSGSVRWAPEAGSLPVLAKSLLQGEYFVEFTPRSQRDYDAHSRIGAMLLQSIAPWSARAVLGMTPHAMAALMRYLSGADRTTLVAQIVRRADQASTANALKRGNTGRFQTARAVPLIQLMMRAMRTLLQEGRELPINRTGAAAWVYDGSLWCPAKRLADAVRKWVKANEPDEAIPGDTKNDRLFDTWQDYGFAQPNPETGKAVWYVTVIGTGGTDNSETLYSHDLTVLRFPLGKVFVNGAEFPAPMAGRIEERKEQEGGEKEEKEEGAPAPQGEESGAEPRTGAGDTQAPTAAAEPAPQEAASKTQPPFKREERDTAQKQLLRKPRYRPIPKAAAPAGHTNPRPGAKAAGGDAPQAAPEGKKNPPEIAPSQAPVPHPFPQAAPAAKPTNAPSKPPIRPPEPSRRKPSATAAPASVPAPLGEIVVVGGVDGSDMDDEFLSEDDDVKTEEKVSQESRGEGTQVSHPPQSPHAAAAPVPAASAPVHATGSPTATPRRMFSGGDAASDRPVLLWQSTPALPASLSGGDAVEKEPPTPTAIAFKTWLKTGLNTGSLAYNAAGAPVHFVTEGMALVSPRIFNLFIEETGVPRDPDGAEPLKRVQREIFQAGWHREFRRKGFRQSNVLTYTVRGRSGADAIHLSMVVLPDPDRYVSPVPPPNPSLVWVPPDAATGENAPRST